ncbi:16S rRNA (guanine(527)-N(7))-methyltransferase RsmG [Belnapia mucosa]|uniref:16S rRNA (guanine(527)-N(7))-methyltransferase RsmG n=1 Tax=Belnapia mucosa TaxID=2804532 RepID=UPI002E2C7403|nr:16S rRNA (guanine(527)-N(7))-methyltransferase RsmG [Belnapia mucosa]
MPIPEVPRETEAKLRDYLALLIRWNQRINLVAKAEPELLWQRHILDSAQLAPLLPKGEPIVDLGSGAGFPGLVLAVLTGREVHLIESDQRKCAFLREAARLLGLDRVTIHALRIEAAPSLGAAIVTARALAPLADLLPHAHRLLRPGGIALFPKGRTAEQELTAASPHWTMQIERFTSSTDPHSTIFRLSEIHPVSAQA